MMTTVIRFMRFNMGKIVETDFVNAIRNTCVFVHSYIYTNEDKFLTQIFIIL